LESPSKRPRYNANDTTPPKKVSSPDYNKKTPQVKQFALS